MKMTQIVVLTAMITLGLYDLVIVTYYGIDGSISKYIQELIFEAPFANFVLGCVCGHLFFYMRHSKMTPALKQTLIDQGWRPPND